MKRSIIHRFRSTVLLAVVGVLAVGAAVLAPGSSAQSTGGLQAKPVTPELQEELAKQELEAEPSDAPMAMSDSSCGSGTGCMWASTLFTGRKELAYPYMEDIWFGISGFTFYSVKNRFGNRKLAVRSSQTLETNCLNPGGEREILPARTQWRVGLEGSRC